MTRVSVPSSLGGVMGLIHNSNPSNTLQIVPSARNTKPIDLPRYGVGLRIGLASQQDEGSESQNRRSTANQEQIHSSEVLVQSGNPAGSRS